MRVCDLRMSKMRAWNAFQEYRKALGKSASPEDAAIMKAYKSLAKGKTVIDLYTTMREVGVFSNGLPRLAIMRADQKFCVCNVYRFGRATFDSSDWPRQNASDKVSLPDGTFPNRDGNIKGRALVPSIPPKFRPPESMLRNYWILWEAVWSVEAPHDPMLLKRLGKNLYAVVASWDLTPVERSVLALRRS